MTVEPFLSSDDLVEALEAAIKALFESVLYDHAADVRAGEQAQRDLVAGALHCLEFDRDYPPAGVSGPRRRRINQAARAHLQALVPGYGITSTAPDLPDPPSAA